VQVSLYPRASSHDSVLLEVIYAAGLRISETVALIWADVIRYDDRCSYQTPAASCSCPHQGGG